jgi:nucleoside-diphosphate-sugar epimerase
MRKIRARGFKAAEVIAKATGLKDPEKVSRALFGLKEREYYFRYKKHPASREAIDARYAELRQQGEEQMARARDEAGRPRLRVLLTGGTGFVGKEILWQAAHDPEIVEMVVLIRPKEIRDRKTGELLETHSPAQRGESLLGQLWLETPEERSKFRFIAGDVEQPQLGVSDEDYAELQSSMTHVIHCAASVAFDDPYERSFQANVTGTLNALRFSLGLQQHEGSPFVAHLGIETSYIHGRQVRKVAREDEIVFPRNFYNNFYELTKAMASLETERFMLEKGLRVVQLCPAIVIGESQGGNNRGDTKVVNAPVNVFGRAHEALRDPDGDWFERTRASMLARMACIFPGNPSAELNLIPVDWVVKGILSAVKRPRAIGERVHLATDNRVTSEQIRDIVQEELGVDIKLAEPTLHRTVTLPVLSKILTGLKQPRIANALEKLGSIFGGYSEWGQPIHEVGNDVRVLGLPEKRPNTQHAFRMLCRHNRYVQDFGRIRDLDEIARREKVWAQLMEELEERSGGPAGAVSAADFRAFINERLDADSFVLR